MDIKDIRHLIKLMVENDLGELEIADGETKVHLKRGSGAAPVVAVAPQAAALPAAHPVPAAPAAAKAEAAEKPSNLIEIKSPMVGTFYAASSPDSEPYVEAGASAGENTVVCIIEAMKVMNEIKAECSGTIREVCVKNAQPVEFGQVLFRVEPA